MVQGGQRHIQAALPPGKRLGTQCIEGWVSSPGVKRPWHGFDHLLHLVPRLKNDKTYKSTPFLAFVACCEVTFSFARCHGQYWLKHVTASKF